MESEERRREQKIAAAAEPEILDALGRGMEPEDVARRVAESHGIDEVKAYRWTVYIDEQRKSRRKRIAFPALAAAWLGVIGVAVGTLALLFAWTVASTIFWILLIVVGAAIGLPGLIVALLARKMAYRKGA